MDTKAFDVMNNFNTSTSMFTAPFKGYYLFSGSVLIGSNTSVGIIGITKNGTTEYMRFQEVNMQNTSNLTLSGSEVVYLNAGETMGVMVYQSSGTTKQTLAGIGYTRFSGRLLIKVP